MSLWRLEWLRLIRTRRLVALLGVFLFFGFLGPLSARYMKQIIENFGGNIQIVVPDPVPADGITQYVGNAIQIGLLVSVGIAAAALAFDAKPQMGIFLRTRVRRMRDIITPRYVVTAVAAIGSFVLGSLYLAFAIAVTALVAARAKSVMLTVVMSVVILLLLPIVGVVPDVGQWLPSHLLGGIDGLVRGSAFGEYIRATIVTVVITVAALWLAVRWAEQREL